MNLWILNLTCVVTNSVFGWFCFTHGLWAALAANLVAVAINALVIVARFSR